MRHSRNVMFVHVPKTGGTSIRSFLDKNGMDHWNRDQRLVHHDPLYMLLKHNEVQKDTFVFSVVRNPYTRAFSYYKHFLYQNGINRTFHYFLNYVRNRGMVLLHRGAYQRTPMIIYNQSYYLHDDNGEISLDKIYRYENLAEFEQDFDVNLPKYNVGNYTTQEYIHCYDKQCIGLVKQIYLEDFINFKYSTDFENSLL